MKRLLRYLFGRTKDERPHSPSRKADNRSIDWLPEHRLAWSAFLGTPAGVVLRARFEGVVAEVTTQALKDPFHTTHSAGTANGWRECQAWLESLSRSSRVFEDLVPDGANASSPPGETDVAEQLSP